MTLQEYDHSKHHSSLVWGIVLLALILIVIVTVLGVTIARILTNLQ